MTVTCPPWASVAAAPIARLPYRPGGWGFLRALSASEVDPLAVTEEDAAK